MDTPTLGQNSADADSRGRRPLDPSQRPQGLWKPFLSLLLDKKGRFSALRSFTLLLLMVPAVQLAYRTLTGQLGGRPVMEATHFTGDWTVYLLLAALAVTPARTVLNWVQVAALRRRIGVAAFCYALLHFSLYILDQNFQMLTVAREIALRIYLTIGFAVLLGLLALAATSTDAALRRMGRNWKRLHRLAYPLTALALLHYFLQSKADVSAAVFVTGLYLWEMLWRLLPLETRASWWPLPPLALAAGLATAAVEFAWYAAASRINPWMVLSANLNLDYGPRPAVAVTIAAMLLSVAALLRRWRRSRVAVA